MTLRRTGRHLAAPKIQRATIKELLVFIGMPRKAIYLTLPWWKRKPGGIVVKDFWKRYSLELDAILRDAHMHFRAAMKRAHPDHGGSVEEASKLNQAWGRIRKLFAKHGAVLSLLL